MSVIKYLILILASNANGLRTLQKKEIIKKFESKAFGNMHFESLKKQ